MIFKSEHELLTLREAGHAPYWEAPGEFNRVVLDFLRRNFARGTDS
ncbi:MAG TPA: alpha/beta hydrolase [Terrimicrobiaceae bacterium]|nr:alpha/beta hydrolase [Terrimicrobiaceae bacterium]